MMQNNSGQANKATIWFIVGFIAIVTVVVIVAAAYSGGGTPSNTASEHVRCDDGAGDHLG